MFVAMIIESQNLKIWNLFIYFDNKGLLSAHRNQCDLKKKTKLWQLPCTVEMDNAENPNKTSG